MKLEGAAIRRHHGDVPGETARTASIRAGAPVLARWRRRNAARCRYEKDVVGEAVSCRFGPRHDRRMRPGDPPGSRRHADRPARRQNASLQSATAPYRCRMRHRDPPFSPPSDLTCSIASAGRPAVYAIPEHTTIRLSEPKQGALPDRETGLDPDAGKAEIVAPDESVAPGQVRRG